MNHPATPAGAVERWLTQFNSALEAQDAAAAAALFGPESYWRDLVALSWNIVTVEGREGVRHMLNATLSHARPQDFALTEPPVDLNGVAEAWLSFRTGVGRGIAHLRLRDGHAFTLLTALRELDGHEEHRGARRPVGAEHGIDRARRSWREQRDAELSAIGRERQPEVLIVGGGQAGLALAARLRQLQVPALVVDRLQRPGEQWRRRYKTLCLHDPVWMDHMPYLPFPDTWPVFTPKDRMADWLAMYAEMMELAFWGSTTVLSARHDEASGRWVVDADRGGEAVVLRPRQLVLSTGLSGRPQVPVIPGQDEFAGEQHHSSAHPGPDGYAGKRVVVIGSNNSAFDICHALYEGGAAVTMVQRSSTHVVRSDTVREVLLSRLFSEQALADGVTTERADLIMASLPHRLGASVARSAYAHIAELDRDFYAGLERANFWNDFGPDGTGMSMKFLRRASGYYIDVGAAQLIIDGRVALAHGEVARLTEDAVMLTDGTRLQADLVVYATGYGPMSDWIAELVSPDVAERVGPIWGLGSGTERDPGPWEGELRNVWKPTAQPGLWIHAGNLQMARHYSLYLALQLKARTLGMPTPVYAGPGVPLAA
jgi:putative flavoprotein involved in K+ transport